MSTVWLNGMEENPLSFLQRAALWTESVRIGEVADHISFYNGQNEDGSAFTIADAIAVVEAEGVTVFGHVMNMPTTSLWDRCGLEPNRRYTVRMRSQVQFDAYATVQLLGSEVIEFVQDLEASGWWFCHDVH